MNTINPTPLRIGMAGTLFGKSYRVAGRVVLGMEQDGRMYYWNEFNLVSSEGEPATLVFEPDEQGGAWRLFTQFEPEYPITAEDAASKSIGSPLNLDGTGVQVTLKGKSQIYYIEGQPPEGEAVGEVANYFNASGANTMIVVSWTGDEVECYRGSDVTYDAVRSLFKLTAPMPANFGAALDSQEGPSTATNAFKILAVLGVAILIFGGYFISGKGHRPMVETGAPACSLKLGSSGTLDGRLFKIRSHSVMEISQVGRRFRQHEYQLSEENGDGALLVCGIKPGAKDWHLFKPLHPLVPLTPEEAAAKGAGQTVNVDGHVAPVTELFQGAEMGDPNPGDVFYGFVAQSGPTLVLARWNDSVIVFYEGNPLTSKEVETCFH